jgi:ATP-binding cassette subfamily B protein
VNKSQHHHRILVDLIRNKKWLYIGSVIAVSIASYFMFLVPTIGKIVIDRVITEPRVVEPGFVQTLIDNLGGAQTLSSLLWIAGAAVVIATALSGLFMYLKDYLAATACESTILKLREDLFAHLHRLSESYLNKSDSGDIVQRCTSDIDTLREFLTLQVMDMGRTIVLMCIVIPLMFMQSVIMSVMSLILVPIVFGFAWVFFGKIKKLFQQVDEAEGALTTIVQENLTGIRVVRAFARQDYECEKFDDGNRHYRELHYKLICTLADFWASSDLFCITQNGIALIGGAWLVSQGQISMGTYFAFIGYTNMLIWPIRQLGQQLSEAGKATVSIGRIQEILAAPEETTTGSEIDLPTNFNGNIEFDRVSFGFDELKPVIRDVSFKIAAGETIAIVGPTGAGKSALIQLLMRLHDYKEGSIKLGGIELNQLRRQSVRQGIGSLLQEPFLFSRSLRENIKFGQHLATDDQMIRSTSDASVHHTIDQFQHKYDTVIGERGVSLSGGQKQRVTLSRTLIQDTPILVLDDTLSAVDSNTEREIIKALHKKRGEQTLIIITHRISVCRNADRVFVMQEGRLSAQGTHEELESRPGFYQDLWEIQSGQREEFNDDLVANI